ncbi:hypothetical protein BN440_3240 [Erwinia amylovora MR1]|nr:hypothetical protein BN440_3240 [Erwinia amylovora MR1]
MSGIFHAPYDCSKIYQLSPAENKLYALRAGRHFKQVLNIFTARQQASWRAGRIYTKASNYNEMLR